MPDINTIDDLIALLERGADESLQLEFKSSAALARDSKTERELCKDVSAFANSAGGLIIYGVREEKIRKSFELDGGVTDEKINVEWIQQKLNSYVHPKIEGIIVRSLRLASGGSVYLIDVPATTTGPHQAPDRRYYKRYNKLSESMEDYEIRDVMGRSNAPILSLYVAAHKAMKAVQYANSFDVPISVRILNRSSTPALYATFSLFIDARLTIIDNGDTKRGEVINISGQPVTHVYRNFAAPNDFPFFKETRVMPTRFRVAAPIPALQDSYALIGEVSCPGFTRRFNGRITINLLGMVDVDWPETMLS